MARQLAMCTDLSRPLPELKPLGAGYSLKNGAEAPWEKAWEVVCNAAFGGQWMNYTLISNDPTCAPERVFIVRLYGQAAATATAQLRENGTGTIHMVGTHPYYTGDNAAAHAIVAAMKSLKDLGVTYCNLTTDDHRLPAIATYEKLGFKPIIEQGDTEMEERWAAVHAKMAEYEKKPIEKKLLWENGPAPYSEMYPNQPQPFLTCYPVEGARGAVVVCPGGGYYIKADHEGWVIAKMLNSAGIAAYVLDYRVSPCHGEAPLADAHRAIRVVRAMGYEKVGILGFSAGGHLTATAATLYTAGDPAAEDPIERLSSRPDAFVPCYAVSSFREGLNAGCHRVLLGDMADDEAVIRRFSAECNVTEDTPAAFIWHCADDGCVPVECCKLLAKAMDEKKVPYELHIFAKGGHGAGLALESGSEGYWGPMLKLWLKDQGF